MSLKLPRPMIRRPGPAELPCTEEERNFPALFVSYKRVPGYQGLVDCQ